MQLENLKELGLSDGQIRVYSALLSLGTSSLGGIQEKTSIERRNIYDILNKLIEKGLVSYIAENGKKSYQCTHPNNIIEDIQEKQKKLEQLQTQVPSMIAFYEQVKVDIHAEVFRGNDAIKALLMDVLNYKESYWIGGNSGVERTSLKFWFGHWMKKRVERKHLMYDLVDHGTFLEDLKPTDIKTHRKNYYKYCSLPPQLSSPMIMIIYGNKVAQLLWQKKPFAFVMESKEIKESFMKYFNYFWKEPY
ncbi:MAG: helix-turn-helix domain-containing protein [Candidatus Woesearchaeota archaeon]